MQAPFLSATIPFVKESHMAKFKSKSKKKKKKKYITIHPPLKDMTRVWLDTTTKKD